MADDRKDDDDALQALFDAGRSRPPEMSDDFLSRLTADAEANVPKPVVTPPGKPSVFGGLKGWFAASGLSGAAVLGVWIGFVMPETVSTLTLAADETVGLYTFLPGADLTAPELGE